jgi:hypothetical protein
MRTWRVDIPGDGGRGRVLAAMDPKLLHHLRQLPSPRHGDASFFTLAPHHRETQLQKSFADLSYADTMQILCTPGATNLTNTSGSVEKTPNLQLMLKTKFIRKTSSEHCSKRSFCRFHVRRIIAIEVECSEPNFELASVQLAPSSVKMIEPITNRVRKPCGCSLKLLQRKYFNRSGMSFPESS